MILLFKNVKCGKISTDVARDVVRVLYEYKGKVLLVSLAGAAGAVQDDDEFPHDSRHRYFVLHLQNLYSYAGYMQKT